MSLAGRHYGVLARTHKLFLSFDNDFDQPWRDDKSLLGNGMNVDECVTAAASSFAEYHIEARNLGIVVFREDESFR